MHSLQLLHTPDERNQTSLAPMKTEEVEITIAHPSPRVSPSARAAKKRFTTHYGSSNAFGPHSDRYIVTLVDDDLKKRLRDFMATNCQQCVATNVRPYVCNQNIIWVQIVYGSNMEVSSLSRGYPMVHWMLFVNGKIPSFEMDDDWG